MTTKTEWEIEVDTAVWNQSVSVFINATAEGLKIDKEIIPWAEIDQARESLAPETQNWGAGITTQPAYRAEQERRNQEARELLAKTALLKPNSSDPLGIYEDDGCTETVPIRWIK